MNTIFILNHENNILNNFLNFISNIILELK